MTTRWAVPGGLWKGETVAVLASGPGMTQALADSVRKHRRICARRAVRLAPDADMLIALDGPPNEGFWEETRGFQGLRVCGVECELDAFYLNMPWEVVPLSPGKVIHMRNNGLAAIRIAAMTGASEILLLGFSPETNGHFYDDPATLLNPVPGHGGEWYPGLTIALAALIEELRAKGIAVQRVDVP